MALPVGPERAEALAEDARTRFEALYERLPSWEVPVPQPAFVSLWERGLIRGPVLDVGCGTGENALFLASEGVEVYGIDLALSAVGMARAKAATRGLPSARFLVADALRLLEHGQTYETVIDSGLFHALCDDERALFVPGLARVLRPGGLYHVLGFADAQPGSEGPRRLGRDEFEAVFSEGWRVLAVEPARFVTNIHEGGARAWLASLRREG